METKNGSVLRKNLGYIYIPQACAELLNGYHNDYLNPYINFYRPCFFPVPVTDHKGRIKKTYPYEEVMTPYERLRNVPRAKSYLSPGVTLGKIGTIANQMSDNQFAERMVNARSKLFQAHFSIRIDLDNLPMLVRGKPQLKSNDFCWTLITRFVADRGTLHRLITNNLIICLTEASL